MMAWRPIEGVGSHGHGWPATAQKTKRRQKQSWGRKGVRSQKPLFGHACSTTGLLALPRERTKLSRCGSRPVFSTQSADETTSDRFSSSFRHQRNAWLHGVATLAVIVMGFILHLTRHDWCWIVVAIVAVWGAEAFNTAFELLCDVASPEFHPLVEKAKDVAAGAVLIAAMGAAAVGALVLGPYVW